MPPLNRLSSLPLPLERGGGRSAVSTRLIFFALLLLGAVIRLTGLSIQSFGFDELWGIRQAALPMGEMMTHLAEQDVQPPAFALLEWIWTRIFPVTETWLRLLPALLGIAAIPLAHGVARRLFGGTVALMATGLIAVHPFLVEYSQEARNYSLLLLASLLSLLMLLQWADKPESILRMVFYILAAVLLPYSHAHGALVLLAQYAWVILSMPALRKSSWIVGALALLLFGPWLLNFAVQTKRVLSEESFVANAGLVRPTFSLMLHWLKTWGGYEPITSGLLLLLAGLGVLTAEGRTRSLLLCLLILPILLPLMASLVSGPVIHVKCGITIIAVLCIAAAAGLHHLPSPISALLLFAIIGVKTGYLLESRQNPKHEPYRELAALARQDHALGAVVIAETHLQKTLGFYLGKEDFVRWLEPEQKEEEYVSQARGGSNLITYLSVRREDYGGAGKFAALPALVHTEVPLYRAKAMRIRLDPQAKPPGLAELPAPYAEGQSPAPLPFSPEESALPATATLESNQPDATNLFQETPAPTETPVIAPLPDAPVPEPTPASANGKLIAPRVPGKTTPVKVGRNN